MVIIMVVVDLSTLTFIIITRSTITIKTKEIPLTALITTSIKGISILLVKVEVAHQHHKLIADQELRRLIGHQQDLQHHSQGEQKAELHHRTELHHRIELQHQTELQHRTDPHHLTKPQHQGLAGHQHHKQIDHRQTDLLEQDHHRHRALQV